MDEMDEKSWKLLPNRMRKATEKKAGTHRVFLSLLFPFLEMLVVFKAVQWPPYWKPNNSDTLLFFIVQLPYFILQLGKTSRYFIERR